MSTKMYSREVPETAQPGFGPIRRTVMPIGPEMSVDGVTNIYEAFQHGVALAGNGNCVGYRPVVNKATGEVGPFKWLSYNQVNERLKNFASGLVHIDACQPNEDGLKCLGFYAKNRLEWVVGEQACYRQGFIPVPLYDTLGADSVEYVVRQTSLKSIVCSNTELETVIRVSNTCADEGLLKTAFIMDDAVDPALKEQATASGVAVYSMKEVEAMGRANPTPATPPSPQDVAFFCYTSGTTGNPKGALITHQSFISCAAAVKAMGLETFPEDVHLSYLPLPHVFERSIQNSMFFGGGSIGFYQGDSLKILEDLEALRPTIFPSVPRLLNRVYDKIIAGAQEAGGIKTWLFNKALAAKLEGLEYGSLTHPIWDRLVFNPLKKRLGFDRLRIMITGSAPIASHVMNFLRAAFGIPVHEGYGQTESSTAITFTLREDLSTGHVGAPIPCNEIRLEDVPEMGYLSTDRVHGDDPKNGIKGIKCLGRGEICFRGTNVFKGYYKMEDKTAETVDEQGWCHTGDIGLWTENGLLKIIDRKKNIFKLAQGEYVAAEKIENTIAASPFIMQSFVYGDSLQSQLVAVVVVDPEYVEPWAAKNGVSGDLKAIVGSPKLKAEILKGITSECKSADLKGFEYVRNIHVESQVFSTENGLLTPTFKLKRAQARDFYREVIDELYAELTKSKL